MPMRNMGAGVYEKLRGMFAFAIWDGRSRTLFFARDRVGKKPLFYFLGQDRFLFASEIKALLVDDTVPRDPDPIAIDHFLALGYVPGPRTAFTGIRKLPAAHWLEIRDGKDRDRPLLAAALHAKAQDLHGRCR